MKFGNRIKERGKYILDWHSHGDTKLDLYLNHNTIIRVITVLLAIVLTVRMGERGLERYHGTRREPCC
jgi:hypothetical protein